ncbi:MAG TPA: serine/threonine-protein kinase [Polyangiaceae bacterium]|nr:serine/threonine-protein kinase [Polyangiaceae bacterium]
MSTPPSVGSPTEDDPFGWVGATVDGKYRVDQVVGHGGFGIVYRAHHLGFEEKVALKCLKLPKELQGGDRDRFRDSLVAEGRLLLQLSRATTGVVQALDVGAVVSPSKIWTPYLVLEWLEGAPLDKDLLQRRQKGEGGRTLGEALEMLDGAARALGVAHGLGIAHRDIKPANLFLIDLAGRRTIKVLDFGIAKVLAESDSVTRAFEETGGTVQAFTARYGAPEQFSRRFGATGPWTDVFALALVFVEVVLGAPALDGTDAAQLFVAASDKLIRPTLRPRGFDPGDAVEAVLATALSVDPRERYPNANAFWDALTVACKNEPLRLSQRPPRLVDHDRPTREISGGESSNVAPFSMSGGYSGNTGGSAPSVPHTSQPSLHGAPSLHGVASAPGGMQSPPTELSSSQGIRSPDTGLRSLPPPRSKLVSLIGVALLAGAGVVGAMMLLNPKPESLLGLGSASASAEPLAGSAALPAPLPPPVPAPAAAPSSKPSSKPTEPETPSPAPTPAASLPVIPPPQPGAVVVGVPWPGTQFRQIAGGATESGAWLDSFRIVRRPDAMPNLDRAFRSCAEIGLGLCTESQWQAACSAFAEVGKDRSLIDSLESGGVVERGGGSGCSERKVIPAGTEVSDLGLCCERSIAMTSKNLQKQFLSSTSSVLKKLENALNQHDIAALTDLFDDKLKLDGVERSKTQVLSLLAQTFKASPDLVVTHESCEVTVQANKIVKRSKRGRKVSTSTSYETTSWTAACKQMRHQKGEATLASAEYVFSPASKLRSLSGKNQASD